MATVVNNLGFRMTSSWDASGMTEARRDIEKLRTELAAISDSVRVDVEIKKLSESTAAVEELTRDRRLTVTVELEGLDIARAALDELTRRRTARIEAEADTDRARAALEELTRMRLARIEAEADTSRARAELDELARNRSTSIQANVDGSSMSSFGGSLTNIYVIIGAIIAGLEALAAVAVVVGAVLVTALGAGVIGAGLAVLAMNDKMVKSQKEARQAAQDTADTANQSLVKAYKSVSDAQRTVGDTAAEGARSVQSASQQSVSANQAVKQSQLDVTAAYKDAQRSLEDLQMQQAQSGDDVESARIALARAQERQATLGLKGPVSGLDVREAINNTALAQDHLNSTMEKAKRTNEDANLATSKGVAGSDKVVKAKQNEADAERKAAEAKQNVVVAQQKAAENNQKAQEALTAAVQGVTQAQREATKAQQNLNKVIAEGSDTLHTFLAAIASMAEPLRGPMRDALNSFKTQLQEAAPAITGLFASAAQLIKPFADSISGVVKNLLPGFMVAIQNAGPVVSGFGDGVASFAKGISNMFIGMAPASKAMGDAWRVVGTQFGIFLDLWGKFVGSTGSQGVKILDGILTGVNALTVGLMGASKFVMAVFEPITKGWSTLISGFKNDQMSVALKKLSDSGDKLLKPLKALFNDPQFQASLKDFATHFGPLLVTSIASVTQAVGNALTVILKFAPPVIDVFFKISVAIMQLITWITELVKIWTDFATTVVSWFTGLSNAGDAWFISWSSLWTKAGSFLTDTWHTISGTFSTSWDGFWNTIKSVSTSTWSVITSGFTSFGTGLEDGFKGIVDKITSIWDGIRHAFGDPINAVIGFAHDTIGMFVPDVKNIPFIKFADGGEVSGPGGSRDDMINARLSNKEFVVNADGAQKNLAALHHANSGGTIIPGFKDGGSVGDGVGAGINGTQSPIDWMVAQAKSVAPALQVTSTFRPGDPGWHGKGKAADFSNGSDDTPQMQAFASWIAEKWGSKTLELIHSPFSHNIKNGKDVGDGVGLYGAATMSEHRNHVHWAVDSALGDGKGGFLGGVASAAGAVLGSVRDVAAKAFEKLTNPVLGAIPDPALGTGKPYGSFPKSFATYGRDQIANLLKGSSSTSAAANIPIGGRVPEGEHLSLIDAALALTSTPPPGSKAAWEAGMNTLITRESGWNSAAINMTDSNAAAGHPSKGLAQTIDSTFAAHAVPGHTNIWEPVDNIAASINYIKGRYGDIGNVQQANANMPARGYASGTNSAAPGLAIVGEKGPEIVNFKGGEEVLPLTSASAQAAGQNFVKANISQAASDLHIDTSGSGFIPQLFTQSFSYGQQLASYAAQKPGVGYDPQPGVTPANPGQSGPTDVHFHTNGVDEALKKWRQQVKIQGMGFNI